MDHYESQGNESGYLISVADIMTGLIFVFIIILALFVVNFQVKIQEKDDQRVKLTEWIEAIDSNNKLRDELLEDIQRELAQENISIEVNKKYGMIRLSESTIQFDTGSDALSGQQLEKLDTVSRVLGEILPCYAATSPAQLSCDDAHQGKLDSVLIEGHTDNVPIRGLLAKKFKDNWELSTYRAIFTYRRMKTKSPFLQSINNTNQQPIISVSGYGDGRPVPGHEYNEPTNDPVNRRIDLRFIMAPPSVDQAKDYLNSNYAFTD